MSNLDKQVLVLNRSWQPINVMTVQKALSMMAADAATAFDFCEDGYFVPVRWQNWLELPVREQDDGIRTPSRVVRVPRVIIAIQFDKVPLKRPPADLEASSRTRQSPLRLHAADSRARRMFDGACCPKVQGRDNRMEKRRPGRQTD